MNYQAKPGKPFYGKYHYCITFGIKITDDKSGNAIYQNDEDKEFIEELDGHFTALAIGIWERKGAQIYFDSLDDAFKCRLLFDEKINKIQKVIGSAS